jgi:DNA (cytosine-5)-methyltransferase 1
LNPNELIVDSFAGGGGASLGISWALGRSPDIAINHDKEAIALHRANHADSLHLSEDVWQVDPVQVCAGRPVGLMWLSPDCKHFSKAKGGKPVSKKVRGLAWVAVRWAKAVRPRVIVLENVEEFQTWGPVLRDTQRPCPERKGDTFRSFIRRLTRLGYVVEWRELRACDYGAPTIRKRLFLIARCDGQPIAWPQATYGKGRAQPWHTAAECIDWTIKVHSIFLTKEEGKLVGVKRPLAPATLRRIARGIQKFVIDAPIPFIVGVGGRQGQSPERPLNKPYQTITSKADSAIIVPSLISLTHQGDDSRRVLPLTEPFPTITAAHRGEVGLIAPTLIQTGYGEREGQAPRVPGLDKPLGTLVAGGGKHALVAAFLAKHYTGVDGVQLSVPMPTVTSIDHNALVTAHIKRDFGTSTGAAVDTPMPTITSDGGGHASLVQSFLVAYYGNEKDGGSLFDPMRTVTSKDRYGLVTIHGMEYIIADIAMRMLAPRELYRAQGFPDSYKIDIEYNGKPLTKTAQVRMVGNSVCPQVAAAIITANIGALPVVPEIAA